MTSRANLDTEYLTMANGEASLRARLALPYDRVSSRSLSENLNGFSTTLRRHRISQLTFSSALWMARTVGAIYGRCDHLSSRSFG